MAAYGIYEDCGWFGKEIERVVVCNFYRPRCQVGKLEPWDFNWDVIGYSKFQTSQDVTISRELNHGSSVIAESKYLIVSLIVRC